MKRINMLIMILIIAELVLLAIILPDIIPGDAIRASWKSKSEMNYQRAHSVPVLLYHNIVEDDRPVRSPFTIRRGDLVRHFDILREKQIAVIPLSELAGDNRDSLAEKSGKSVVITFDDDYLAMYRILFPLVKEYGYPVTLFVYTEGIGRPGTGGLDWAMLREMEKGGVDIQSHSFSHRDLTAVVKDESAGRIFYEEFILSKKVIENNLNKSVSYFAFPYGRYNLELLELARKAGYERVFSTDYGPNIITRDNFCLRRHHIKNSFSDEQFISIVE